MTYDYLILKAIAMPASAKAVNLVEILWYVDAHDKTLLNFDELEGGLRRLIQDKKIIEAGPLTYRLRLDGDLDRDFSGLTQLDYGAAVTEYHRQFFEAYSALIERDRWR